jgi:hypothetical protein
MRSFFMKKILIGGLLFILVIISLFTIVKPETISKPQGVTPHITTTQDITYKGQEGKDALTLLKSQAVIEQDASGMVSSINHKKANFSKHEYWAFYINGKLAQVGPASYKTKNTDTLLWKIEKY